MDIQHTLRRLGDGEDPARTGLEAEPQACAGADGTEGRDPEHIAVCADGLYAAGGVSEDLPLVACCADRPGRLRPDRGAAGSPEPGMGGAG